MSDFAPTWEPYGGAASADVPLLVRRRVMSPFLRNFRDIMVALPRSYLRGGRRYPAVYMHDGQNLFDPETSHAGDWRLGPTLAGLAERGIEVIAVAIPNAGPDRIYEYSPFRDPRLGGGGADRYLDFVARTVKSMIDRTFRTRAGPEDTVIAGSSMGGLVSLHALARFPEVFGGAGALSPSVWFAGRALLTAAREWAARTPRRRIYLDVGLEEGDETIANARALRDILIGTGYRPGVDLDYLEDPTGEHDEASWGRRVGRAIPFLLGVQP